MLFKMAEEQQPQSNQPEMPKRSGPPRRRGRRGGRGRRRPDQLAQAPVSGPQIEAAEPIETEFPESDVPPPPKQSFQPKRRSGSPLLQAADEAADIIESLKQA